MRNQVPRQRRQLGTTSSQAFHSELHQLTLPYAVGGDRAHSHGHGGHGHSHGGHGHSHGGHGHSHGAKQKEPTPQERQKHRERLHRIWDDDDDENGETFGFSSAKSESMPVSIYHLYQQLLFICRSRLWVYAFLSTILISLMPFVILFFFTFDNSPENEGRLKIALR